MKNNQYLNVSDIREMFKQKLQKEEYVIDKSGVKTVEIVNASFISNEETIFGKMNYDWCERELDWYKSQSLFVEDIKEPIPEIWKSVSSSEGKINSNYGWCIFSQENGYQYINVLKELKKNPNSRRAQMIYTRPSMHYDYNKDGMSDFMCCSNTVHLIRDSKLETVVYFRSNDAVFGYKGDRYWMNFVHNSLADHLEIEPGNIYWNASSLHIYSRHFHFINE